MFSDPKGTLDLIEDIYLQEYIPVENNKSSTKEERTTKAVE